MGKIANFFKALGNNLKEIGVTFAEGDWKTKVSFLIMGFGPLMRGFIARGLAFLAAEIAFICYMVFVGAGYLAKFGTLGTEETHMDPKTFLTVYGDNSFLILLYGVLSILLILVFIVVWRMNISENRKEEKFLAEGHKVPSVKKDLASLLDSNFHVTLLSLPTAGIAVFMILPIIFMICVAFTNYDFNHQAPSKLFTWVGFDNFAQLASFGG